MLVRFFVAIMVLAAGLSAPLRALLEALARAALVLAQHGLSTAAGCAATFERQLASKPRPGRSELRRGQACHAGELRQVQPRPSKGLAPLDEDSARCCRDPHAGVLSRRHRLRAAADVGATPV